MKRWAKKVKKHISTVLRGRCDTMDAACLVAKAILTAVGADGIRRLRQTPEFVSFDKQLVSQSLEK
eukprot:1214425-Pleurochrysis_carterae.AAC.1